MSRVLTRPGGEAIFEKLIVWFPPQPRKAVAMSGLDAPPAAFRILDHDTQLGSGSPWSTPCRPLAPACLIAIRSSAKRSGPSL